MDIFKQACIIKNETNETIIISTMIEEAISPTESVLFPNEEIVVFESPFGKPVVILIKLKEGE